MTQTIRIFEVILVCLPVLTLFVIGVAIVVKPVSLLNRRWYLLALMPLLLANLLAMLAESLSNGSSVGDNASFWLILAVDSFLSLLTFFAFRGVLVYGASAAQVEATLMAVLRDKGLNASSRAGRKRTLFREEQDARIVEVQSGGRPVVIYILDRDSEVLIQGASGKTMAALRKLLSERDNPDRAHQARTRWIGLLYIVLALVFAVLVLIFFFEPRLVLIE